jgi:hypothetical protein
MLDEAPLPLRLVCAGIRSVLVLVSLALGLVLLVPLAILAPPLAAILAGLLVLTVLASTSSMAKTWQAARVRRQVR